ncbi:MAG: DUF4422 domain-containing protein [Acetobacter fabarum]|uniref:DUF4422 domain-containing protein n=1 Tax=Acetobacter fabarum TaxID=483199 RepID=UPI0039EB8CF3
MDIRIYVYHHADANINKNRYFEPIQGGRSIADTKFAGMIGDDTGDNISARNRDWGELTALYWIWKNTRHDYVGLNTEKSYLNFSEHGRQQISLLNKQMDFIDFCSQNIEERCSQHRFLTAPITKIHPPSAASDIQTFYENYGFEHDQQDLDLLLTLIKNEFGAYYETALITAHIDTRFHDENIFMKRDVFDEYCAFVFSVLFAFEKVIDTSGRSPYQKKVFRFLYAFLSNVFLMKHFMHGSKEAFFQAGEIIVPKFAKQYSINAAICNPEPAKTPIAYASTIHIAISFDDNYAEHALVALYSLLSNTQNGSHIHFHVLHDQRLSPANIHRTQQTFPGSKFSFYDVSADSFSNFLPHNRQHISRNTYYRLIMHEVLPADIKRLIYVDLDTIFCDDITLLWNMDLKGKILGGCMDEGGITHSRKLFGRNYNTNYINAGILVIDLAAAREKYGNLKFLYLESFVKNIKSITLQDQDIINIAFRDDIQILPLRWNAGGRLYSHNEQDVAYTDQEQDDAATNPAIVHFTGEAKPWVASCEHPLKELYFIYQARLREQAGG